ncbi:MAG: hypothetical protein ABIT38_13190, partial [Gemmatimonadaceae bacterium]
RLQDLLGDWIALNADLISIQRMKNLLEGYPGQIRERLGNTLAAFADHARTEAKDARWKALASEASFTPTSVLRERTPAWPYRDVDADVSFAPRSNKRRAVRARLADPVTLFLRLRQAFGVGVKADVLTYLICRTATRATAREIAEATGYTQAATRRAVDDLAESRFTIVTEGQPAFYRIAIEQWAPLLELSARTPDWGSWQERFAFMADLANRASAEGAHQLTDYSFGVLGRQLMEAHRAAFAHDAIAEWSSHSAISNWGDFFENSVERLATWIEEHG